MEKPCHAGPFVIKVIAGLIEILEGMAAVADLSEFGPQLQKCTDVFSLSSLTLLSSLTSLSFLSLIHKVGKQ